jgi:NAD-dependent DNA ligase
LEQAQDFKSNTGMTFFYFIKKIFFFLSGEVYISNNDFRELNEVRKMKNETVFSTARNAAAGSLRTLGAN